MAPSFVLDPRRGSSRVQVADDLRLFGRHSGGVHPDVLPPDELRRGVPPMRYPTSRPRRQRRRAGRTLGRPCRGDLLACRSRCLEAGREQRLCPPMLRVAGGEQAGCILHVLGRERNNPELHDRSLAETKLVGADARVGSEHGLGDLARRTCSPPAMRSPGGSTARRSSRHGLAVRAHRRRCAPQGRALPAHRLVQAARHAREARVALGRGEGARHRHLVGGQRRPGRRVRGRARRHGLPRLHVAQREPAQGGGRQGVRRRGRPRSGGPRGGARAPARVRRGDRAGRSCTRSTTRCSRRATARSGSRSRRTCRASTRSSSPIGGGGLVSGVASAVRLSASSASSRSRRPR